MTVEPDFPGCEVRDAAPSDPWWDAFRAPPERVVTPTDDRACAAALARASSLGRAVVPWAGGRHQRAAWVPRADWVLDLAQLCGICDLDAADQTVTVKAATPLRELNDAVAESGLWLPVDPMRGDRATIGGALAAGASGPLEATFGPLRDQVLGCVAAYGDGVLARSGGRLVKNVTGFDLHRLFAGSMGTLAVVTEIHLRLRPLPQADETALARIRDPADLDRLVEWARDRAPAPAALVAAFARETDRAVEPLPPGAWALCRSMGTRALVDRVLGGFLDLAPSGSPAAVLSENEAREAWCAVRERFLPWNGDGAVVRLGVLPMDGVRSRLGDAVAELLSLSRGRGGDSGARALVCPVSGRIHLGFSRAPDPALVVERIRRLPARTEVSFAVESASPAFRLALGRLVPPRPTLALERRVRAALDPGGVMSPGRLFEEGANAARIPGGGR